MSGANAALTAADDLTGDEKLDREDDLFIEFLEQQVLVKVRYILGLGHVA